MLNTGSYVDNVTKTTVIMIFVNFANKSTPTQVTPKMMTNGLAVMNVTDG